MSQSLDRAIRILYGAVDAPITIREASELLGVHHSTALRLLQTLKDQRLMTRLPDGRYRLGSGMIWIASRALEQLDLRQVARPFLVTLSEQTTETVHLAVLEGDNVVYIDKVESPHPVRMYSRVGALARLHCSGVAKALVAFADDETQDRLIAATEFIQFTPTTITTAAALRDDLVLTRERGYAIDDEEHEQGIRWLAAPVFGVDGESVASISVSAPIHRVDRDHLLGFIPALLEATAGLSAELGYRTRSNGLRQS